MATSSTREDTAKGLAPVSPFLLDASRLVALGVNVLPIAPGTKRPALPSWKHLQERRLFDEDWDRVDRWLCRQWEETENGLGVVTGAVSAIVVVDVDDEAARAKVRGIMARADWPVTPVARTRKGLHLWFAHPGPRGNRVKVDGVGLDVRGDGGYVVVPPTIHPDGGAYTWVNSPLEVWPPADLPEELDRLLWPPAKPLGHPVSPVARPRARYVEKAFRDEIDTVSSAFEGTRNDTLNTSVLKVSRFVRDGSLSASEVAEAFLEAARRAGLPDREADRTIESAMRAALG
jgi:hypothetical protein